MFITWGPFYRNCDEDLFVSFFFPHYQYDGADYEYRPPNQMPINPPYEKAKDLKSKNQLAQAQAPPCSTSSAPGYSSERPDGRTRPSENPTANTSDALTDMVSGLDLV